MFGINQILDSQRNFAVDKTPYNKSSRSNINA